MVFLFGMDVPLVELLVVIAGIMVVAVFGLIYSLIKESQINKKLDLLLNEEHKIKQELDIAELEESKQLVILKHVVKEIAQLHGIRTKGALEVMAMKEIADEAKRLPEEASKNEHHTLMDKMVQQIERLHKISENESKQLAYINDLVERLKKK